MTMEFTAILNICIEHALMKSRVLSPTFSPLSFSTSRLFTLIFFFQFPCHIWDRTYSMCLCFRSTSRNIMSYSLIYFGANIIRISFFFITEFCSINTFFFITEFCSFNTFSLSVHQLMGTETNALAKLLWIMPQKWGYMNVSFICWFHFPWVYAQEWNSSITW